ncbi:MAG: TetR/AcrR family transcriptional regulator [Myxococcota bacterium]|nr:TetR/AcrR family transcriptional regulator [Myxococcota bacterium]
MKPHLSEDSNSSPDTNRLGLRERKKRETRRRIFNAAFELFLEQGFEETTVEEIAARADVGKGTVFNYFPQKTSLLAALSDDWVSRLFEEFGPVESWTGSTKEQLERVFLFMASLGEQNPDLARLAFMEKQRLKYDTGDKCYVGREKSVQEFQDMTRSVLRSGQLTGEVRLDIDPDRAATLIEAAFHHTFLHWLLGDGSAESPGSEISAQLDIVFDGIARRS